MQNKDLDIIITHYDEPWEIGKPFFDMLQNQRCVDINRVQVTLVQDGKENTLPWTELLYDYSYSVKVITIDHKGPATARNVALKNSSADWIMFCDFDDLFTDVCSLKMVMELFPVTDYDLFWGKMVNEYKWNGNSIFINRVDGADYTNTNCKFYRRKFLEDNNITFNTTIPYHYEYMFNSLFLAYVKPFRIAAITVDWYMYMKTFRENSMRNRIDNGEEYLTTRFKRDCALAETYKRRGLEYEYRKTIAKVIYDEFYRVYQIDKEDPPAESDAFLSFYHKHKDIFNSISTAELDVIKDGVESETMAMIQDFYNKHKIEYYFVNDETPFNEWINHIENYNTPVKIHDTSSQPERTDTEPVIIPNNPIPLRKEQYDGVYKIDEDTRQPIHEPAQPVGREPRVAVYCGTYNTYMSMATSAKSLLYHTKMDKIYFLIEDDVFPYDLPDNGIITCINVKNQEWFRPDGPNFNNDWSYMCLIRAAFTKLIPYKKILSFDIDVVIQEDIGCLWDYDMTDYYLAGVTEPQRQKSTADPIYINFGVVMMNLDKLRNDGIDDKIIDALNTTKFGCPEQDAFNKFCAWHILQLPNDYNATVNSHITGEAEKERIIHYAGIRYWRHFGSVKEYGLKDWDAIIERQAKLNA